MGEDAARQARKGLGGSLAGKAKQVAGAVLGNDSLAAEGQLQEAEAEARKDAGIKGALADAQAQEAAEALSRQAQITEQQRLAATVAAGAHAEQAVHDGHTQVMQAHAEAEVDKTIEQARAATRAEEGTNRIAREAREAQADAARVQRAGEALHDQLDAEAQAAEDAAARAREQAARLDP